MAYTKYSLTPSNNNAAPPDGAPEGMLPSAVNDTMRDMMAQIRDCGDGIRGGTYTMTAPVITGGSINGAAIGASTASTGAFTSLSSTGVLTTGGGIISNQGIVSTNANRPTGSSGNTLFGGYSSGAGTAFIQGYNLTTDAWIPMNVSGSIVTFSTGTSATEKMRIDSSGNVGIGATPNTWTLGKSLSVGDVGSAVFGFSGYNSLTSGCYFNSGWRYSNSSSKPSLFVGADGAFTWSNAAAGTAGNTFTLTQTLGLEFNKSLALQGATSQTGTGITFPATQSASTDANTLDDYEEGTWTPTMGFTSGSVTYTSRTGVYTKVGNLVTIQFEITVNVASSPSGQFTITGLPFAPSAANLGGVSSVRLGSGGGGFYYMGGEIGTTPRIYFAASTTNITAQADCANMIANGFYIKCGASYLTA